MRLRLIALFAPLSLAILALAGCGQTASPRANGLLACLTSMRAVTTASNGDAWIVGAGFTGGEFDFRDHCTDTLRNSNGSWQQVAAAPDVHFLSIAVVSPSDIWAGADNGAGFYHFDGTTWSHHDAFSVPPGSFSGANQAIRAIGMTSGGEGWALLDNATGNLVRYSGGKWRVAGTLDAPDLTKNYSALTSLSLLSASDGWAVGGHYIAHYDGQQWKLVDSPAAKREDVELQRVAMVAPGEGWAVGHVTNANDPNRTSLNTLSGIILRCHDGAWSVVDTPSMVLGALAMVSPSEGWAGGVDAKSGGTLMHLKDGKWSPAEGPRQTTIVDLAMRSPSEGWAISRDAIYHFKDGAWTTDHTRGPNEPGSP
jgi:hypothetical protein